MARRSAALWLTATLLLTLAALARTPWGRPDPRSFLRLSWRTRGEAVKIPRRQDENTPVHMRTSPEEAYDLRIRPCLLVVRVDGKTLAERLVEAPGWRHDRPLSVFQEVELQPGTRQIEVSFQAQALPGTPAPVAREPFRATLQAVAGRASLVTMDGQGQWLLR